MASLQETNADLRIETNKEKILILRIDGLDRGIAVEPETLIEKIEMILSNVMAVSNQLKSGDLINSIGEIDHIYFPDIEPRKQIFLRDSVPVLEDI